MNSWKPFTIPTKRSMLDDWQSSEYASIISDLAQASDQLNNNSNTFK